MKYKLTRNVTKDECHWLIRDMMEGEVVYEYTRDTYGCVGEGTACTLVKGEDPFFELPNDALVVVKEEGADGSTGQ